MFRLCPILCVLGLLMAGRDDAESPVPDEALSNILVQYPSAAAPQAKADAAPENCDTRFDFSKVPPAWPLARAGFFSIPPSGCKYYTLLDLLAGRKLDSPRMPFGLTSLNNLPFFDYDFRYLDNPDHKTTDWSDGCKRIHIGDDWLDSTGGEFRTRYQSERDSRGTGVNNNYYLLRTRVYNDIWFRDEFRLYAEFIYSETMNQNLPPLPIDATGPDLLDAFAEVKVGAPLETPLYIRIGRQEMWYGSQRLVSTLDWANTRRTFQGAKAYWHSDSFDVDAFWTQPVIPNRDRFDSVDDRRNFFGLWTTYKPRPGTAFDLYYLGLTTATKDIEGDVQTLACARSAMWMGDCSMTARAWCSSASAVASTSSPEPLPAASAALQRLSRQHQRLGILRLRLRRSGPGRSHRQL